MEVGGLGGDYQITIPNVYIYIYTLIHCLKSNKLIQFQRSETLMVSLFLPIDNWLCDIFLCIYICLFNDLCLFIHLTASFYFPLMLINYWWIKLNICTFYLFNVRKRKKQCTKEKLFKKKLKCKWINVG